MYFINIFTAAELHLYYNVIQETGGFFFGKINDIHSRRFFFSPRRLV